MDGSSDGRAAAPGFPIPDAALPWLFACSAIGLVISLLVLRRTPEPRRPAVWRVVGGFGVANAFWGLGLLLGLTN